MDAAQPPARPPSGLDINACPLVRYQWKKFTDKLILPVLVRRDKWFFGHIVGKVVLKYYKTRKYFAGIDDLIVWQNKTEAVRNVDSQNEIADLIGIEVHHNHSTLNYCNILRNMGFPSKGKDDKKRKVVDRTFYR